MSKQIFKLLFLLMAANLSFGQNAVLDLESTSEGVLIPRMTTVERNAIPTVAANHSLLVFDKDVNNYMYYDGSAWVTLGDSGGGINLWTDNGISLEPVVAGKNILIKDAAGLQRIASNAASGEVRQFNNTGIETIRLDGHGQGDGGYFSVNRSNGGTGIQLYAHQSAGEGAVSYHRNATSAATIIIDGDSNGDGGKLSVRDSGGSERIQMYSESSEGDGALITMDNLNKESTIYIDSQAEGDAGYVSIRNSEGESRVRLYGEEAEGDGASAYLRNAAGQSTLYLAGQDTGDAGYISVRNSDASSTIRLYGEESEGDGGALYIRNANLANTIRLDGDGSGDGAFVGLRNSAGADMIQFFGEESNGDGGASFYRNAAGNNTIHIDGDEGGDGGAIEIRNSDGVDKIRFVAESTEGDGALLTAKNVADNTTVYLDAQNTGNAGYIAIRNSEGTNKIRMWGEEAEGNSGAIYLYDDLGNKSIELDGDLSGDGRVITDELEIKGGSDFAENFDIITTENSLAPIPGMLVSIDPDATGKLEITSEAFDKKIAGIISGANGIEPGLFMGQEGSIADGEYPIALTGRVYVYASNENGSILPGDLLTSSSTPGYAMKVRYNNEAQGAVIGKAMTKLTDKEGFVLVLVNLQ